jgi:hypothetical protein
MSGAIAIKTCCRGLGNPGNESDATARAINAIASLSSLG